MKERIEDRDLSLLFDISRASNETKLDTYLVSILEGCARWFSASGISVFIREDESDQFVLAAKTGADTTVPDGAHLRAGHGIAGACISSGQPMIVQDPLDNPLLVGRVQPRNDIGSAMIVPLTTPENGCIGVLNVSRRIGEQPFSRSDLSQAAPLARHIAMAIGNARLFAGVNAAVAEARAAHEKLDAIIACLGVGVVVTDAYGAVEQWNPEAEGIFENTVTRGSSLMQAVGLAPQPLKASVGRVLKKALAGSNTEIGPGRRLSKRFTERAHDDKSGRAWSIVASPLPRGGATIAIQDISGHEKALKELDRVKRLAEIGQLTAAIAHEIRNPLTGIRSAAQIVQTAQGELKEFGRIIEQEALKLNALCDDFLDFARPLSLHLERLDLVSILRKLYAEYEATAIIAGVTLHLTMDIKASRIRGDLLRIEQVCRNLILNAIQASRKGGAVHICLRPGKLIVEDEGQGIDSQSVQKLFTPFFTTKANGTGLGLSNVRKIVDAHGWQIEVFSAQSTGTRFEILFRETKAA